MLEILGNYASVPAIAIICYAAGFIWTKTELPNKWIPLLCLGLGAVLGVVGLYVMPEFPASDVISALAVGIASGLAATGANQVVKQLTKDDETE